MNVYDSNTPYIQILRLEDMDEIVDMIHFYLHGDIGLKLLYFQTSETSKHIFFHINQLGLRQPWRDSILAQ